MDKIRIYALAQELGIASSELLTHFEENGLSFSTHLAMVDRAAADGARSFYVMPELEPSESVLAPAAVKSTASLDFAPFEVEGPTKIVEDEIDNEIFAASQEAVAKVERRVAAAVEAPVRQSLLTSAVATGTVAIVPTFVAFATLVFGQPQPRPFLAVLLSILLTGGAIVVGSAIWATQPEAAGFSFGDLMLWSWVRREAAERALIENTAILGFDRFGRFLGNSTASPEEQMRAVREIAAALDAKSSYTLGHSRRVEKHARKVAEVMGLTADDTAALATAAALHDIGNIQIPDAVLRKTGELTIEERSAIEAHVLLGARMVLKAGSDDVVDGIRHHHERWDGAGYPDGMPGEEIPLFARIIGIAEAYDAMTSTRPYRQGYSREHAIEELRSQSGLQFDGDLVEMFVATLPEPLALVRKFPFLGQVQTQIHELQLLFKRMGAVAVSATASTIAIALILGGTVLSPGTQTAPEIAQKNRRVTPIDRVLASRLNNESGYQPTTVLSVAVAPRGSSAPLADLSEEIRLASLDGDLDVSGHSDGAETDGSGGNGDGGNGGGGGGTDPITGGTTNPDPVASEPPSGSSGGSTVDGESTARNDDRDSHVETPPQDPPAQDPPAQDPPTSSTDDGKGKGKGNGNGVGNGGTPPGHENKDDKGPKDNPGNGGTPPGQENKDDKGPKDNPGNGGTPPGHSDDNPGNGGGNDNGGGNGNGNDGTPPGHSEDKPGNSGGDNAGGNGNSDSAPGNSGNSNGNGGGGKDDTDGAGVGAGAGASADDAPGNSGNSNGNGNGNSNGNGKDKAEE